MSVKTWLDEFGGKTDLEKWIGLREDNIEKHGCYLEDLDLKDSEENVFQITGRTCQLCENYYSSTACKSCPLYKIGKYCDDEGSPYRIFAETGNPEPMIQALTRISGELPQRTEKVNKIMRRDL